MRSAPAVGVEIPDTPAGQRFWLFLYAVTSGAYRIFVGVMIILVVALFVALGGLLALAELPRPDHAGE